MQISHRLTLRILLLAQRFRILALASRLTTCSLCPSSRIALSFEVIGFLISVLPLRSDLLSHSKRYTFRLFLFILASKLHPNHSISLVPFFLLLLFPQFIKVIINTRSCSIRTRSTGSYALLSRSSCARCSGRRGRASSPGWYLDFLEIVLVFVGVIVI